MAWIDEMTETSRQYLSHVTKKTVFGDYDQVIAMETDSKLELSEDLTIAPLKRYLRRKVN